MRSVYSAQRDVEDGGEAGQKRPPSWVTVHCAIALSQVIFGIGSVVGQLGVASFNPLLFALIREASAGCLLLLLAWQQTARVPNLRSDGLLFLGASFSLLANQLCMIIGVKLAGGVIGAAWQPSQPMFTAIFAILLGWEQPSAYRIAGILLAFCGAAFMVLTSPARFGELNLTAGNDMLAGNALFFLNCSGTALYVIFSKALLQRGYSAIGVLGWSYALAAVQMIILASIFNTQPEAINFVCPFDAEHDPSGQSRGFDCGDGYDQFASGCSCTPWGVPMNAVFALCYWILGQSVASYYLMTWANKHTKPSNVLGYTALQPLSAAVVTIVLISLTGARFNLKMPGFNLLGGILILIGMRLLILASQRE
eukprot:TRINITY_DN26851_c0_g1_i2.p1 TRINITY_DN26851_c0_g1~~TRINITY_DN26851_c0_g1_i2.p1  ORF type:complete len:367 (-),score=33.83 TRINITY_DN26851_c0_g1_i2:169-1269(-)